MILLILSIIYTYLINVTRNFFYILHNTDRAKLVFSFCNWYIFITLVYFPTISMHFRCSFFKLFLLFSKVWIKCKNWKLTTDNCQFLFNIGNNLLQFSVKFISANYWLSILDSLSFCHELDRLRECAGGNENFFQVFMLYYLFSCNYMVDLFCLPFTCLLTVFVSQTRSGNDIFSGSAIYEIARKFNCV